MILSAKHTWVNVSAAWSSSASQYHDECQTEDLVFSIISRKRKIWQSFLSSSGANTWWVIWHYFFYFLHRLLLGLAKGRQPVQQSHFFMKLNQIFCKIIGITGGKSRGKKEVKSNQMSFQWKQTEPQPLYDLLEPQSSLLVTKALVYFQLRDLFSKRKLISWGTYFKQPQSCAH